MPLDALFPWLLAAGVAWLAWTRRDAIVSWLGNFGPHLDGGGEVLIVPSDRPDESHTHRSGDQRVLCVLDLIRDMEAAGKPEIAKFLRDNLADFGDGGDQ